NAEALRRTAVPVDRGEALRLARECLDVRAVAAVDRDSLAEGDVADDLVAGHRRAALCEPDEHLLDPVHVDAVVLADDRVLRARRLPWHRLLFGYLLGLEALQHLVDDGL